jgi:integrase
MTDNHSFYMIIEAKLVWFEMYKRPILKTESSVRSYERQFRNTFGCRIGDKQLSNIRQIDVQACVVDMLEAGRTSKTINEATGILRQCFEAAMANGVSKTNPTLGAQIPESGGVKRRVLTIAEQAELIDYLESVKHYYTEMVKIMLITGMRIGELGALTWGDIDFTNKVIHISKSYTCDYYSGVKESRITSPKTENSNREIPFFEETAELFLKWKEKVEAKRKELGDQRWRLPEELGDLLFVSALGSPISRHLAEHTFRQIVKEINAIRLDKARREGKQYESMPNINPHACRHTFATRCLEKGMDPRVLQSIMGHSSYETTCSYSHVLEDLRKKETEKIGKFLD